MSCSLHRYGLMIYGLHWVLSIKCIDFLLVNKNLASVSFLHHSQCTATLHCNANQGRAISNHHHHEHEPTHLPTGAGRGIGFPGVPGYQRHTRVWPGRLALISLVSKCGIGLPRLAKHGVACVGCGTLPFIWSRRTPFRVACVWCIAFYVSQRTPLIKRAGVRCICLLLSIRTPL